MSIVRHLGRPRELENSGRIRLLHAWYNALLLTLICLSPVEALRREGTRISIILRCFATVWQLSCVQVEGAGLEPSCLRPRYQHLYFKNDV